LIPKSGEQGCLNRWIKRNIWIVPQFIFATVYSWISGFLF
jgi:hypothetical protein